MIANRQFFVACVFGVLGCGGEAPGPVDSRSCALPAASLVENIELGSEGVAVEVCGEGSVWVQDGPDVRPVSQLVLRRDEYGRLVRGDGSLVLGVSEEGVGLAAVVVDDADAPVVPTRTVTLVANLDASTPGYRPFDELDPYGTSSYSTSVSLFGPAGGQHRVDIHFASQGGGSWEVAVMAEGPNRVDELLGRGVLDFGPYGTLASAELLPLLTPWRTEETPPWVLDVSRVRSVDHQFEITVVDEDSAPASPFAGVIATPRGEVITVYEDGREHVRAWIVDGLRAQLTLAR